MKLTRNRASRMTLPERYAAFCSHESNMTQNERGEYGLSMEAQSELWNNWRLALDKWVWSLPIK